jgi:hypothetical protein
MNTTLVDVDSFPFMATTGVRRRPSEPSDEFMRCLVIAVSASQDHDVRTGEGASRLPQPASGKEIAIDSRSKGIDKNDVQISMKSPMLEAIVEQDDVGWSQLVLE